jgi:hypothetical protein
MDPTYILLAMIVVLIPIVYKAFKDMSNHCNKVNNRVTVVETKLDIYLEHTGFDIGKVNKAIKENIEEIKQNGSPSVGCINIKELYRDK